MDNNSSAHNFSRTKTSGGSFNVLEKEKMAEKKKFLLRIDDNTYAALEKWAADELRSINGQIEYLLKDSLKKAGRLKSNTGEDKNNNDDNNSPG